MIFIIEIGNLDWFTGGINKNKMLRYTILFLMSFTSLLSQAQVSKQEIIADSTNDFAQKPNITPLETRRVIKGGVSLPLFRQSSLTSPWFTFGTSLTVEYKLKHNISLISGVEPNFGFTNKAQLYNVELPVGIRYYFLLNKRMKVRGDFYSFFRPYVSFQTHNTLFANLRYDNESGSPRSLSTYYRGQFLNKVTNLGNLNESFNMLEFVYLQLGYQLKIAKSNYLDISVGIPFINYHKREYTLSTPALVAIRYGVIWPR